MYVFKHPVTLLTMAFINTAGAMSMNAAETLTTKTTSSPTATMSVPKTAVACPPSPPPDPHACFHAWNMCAMALHYSDCSKEYIWFMA